jgi:hypothetical protein
MIRALPMAQKTKGPQEDILRACTTGDSEAR